jgi:hypothetical protein
LGDTNQQSLTHQTAGTATAEYVGDIADATASGLSDETEQTGVVASDRAPAGAPVSLEDARTLVDSIHDELVNMKPHAKRQLLQSAEQLSGMLYPDPAHFLFELI